MTNEAARTWTSTRSLVQQSFSLPQNLQNDDEVGDCLYFGLLWGLRLVNISIFQEEKM